MDPLVARLKQGDPNAFTEAYGLYRARLNGFLDKLTRRPSIAAELLQETWLKLAAEAPYLADDTHLLAWLFTVARNQFLSHQRWALLDGSRLAELFSREHDQQHTVTPEDDASSKQQQAALEKAIADLPVKYREAVLLVAVEHFEPGEAAKILNVSPEAFRQRLSRGRAELKAKLGVDL